jgi:hypothetical protein
MRNEISARFGGIGTGILMHKHQFEIQAELVDALMKQIAQQSAVVENTYAALSKIFAGDLQKLAGATDLTKNLVASKSLLGKANEEIDKLKKLMAECSQAQERAQRALPDFAMFFSEGRQDTVPSRKYFMAGKNATEPDVSAFVFPAREGSIPAFTLADVHLARRFSNHENRRDRT